MRHWGSALLLLLLVCGTCADAVREVILNVANCRMCMLFSIIIECGWQCSCLLSLHTSQNRCPACHRRTCSGCVNNRLSHPGRLEVSCKENVHRERSGGGTDIKHVCRSAQSIVPNALSHLCLSFIPTKFSPPGNMYVCVTGRCMWCCLDCARHCHACKHATTATAVLADSCLCSTSLLPRPCGVRAAC